jgi:hypothetical protein
MRVITRLSAAIGGGFLAAVGLVFAAHAQPAGKAWNLETERGKAYLTYFTVDERMPQRIGVVHHSFFCDQGMIGITVKDDVPRTWRWSRNMRDIVLKTEKATYTVKGDIAPGAGNGGGPMLDVRLTRAQMRAAVESAGAIEISQGDFKARLGLSGSEQHRAAFLKVCG